MEQSEKKPYRKRSKRDTNGKKAPRETMGAGEGAVRKENSAAWGHKDYKAFHNDDSWYGSDDALLKYAGSISFQEILGTPIDISNGLVNHETGVADNDVTLPGVMTLPLVMGPGISSSAYSALTMSAEVIRAKIQREINKNPTYDRTDLMIVMQCLDSIYYMYQYGLRAYETANTYSTTNRYLWKVVLAAQGFDPDDVHANLGTMRYNLLQLANRIEELFFIPYEFPLFKRHQFMLRTVLSDATVIKSQLYQFAPAGYFRWDDTGETGSKAQFFQNSGLKPNAAQTGDLLTVGDYYGIMQAMIEACANSTDFSNMMGDLAKAFGGVSLGVERPAEEATLNVIYHEELLNQIQNATVLPFIGDSTTTDFDTFCVAQNPERNSLIYQPVFGYNSTSGSRAGLLSNRIISTVDNQPDAAKVVKLTRLTACVRGNATTITPITCGSEMVAGLLIYSIKYSTDTAVVNPGSYEVTLIRSMDLGLMTDLSTTAEAMKKIALLEKFDWHPMITTCERSTTTDTDTGLIKTHGFHMYWDVQNYATMTAEQLTRINDSVILAMYNLRSVGRI